MDPRTDDREQLLQLAGEPRHSSLRRLACDACRTRKVRCDRRNPQCSRCAKVGTPCRYSSRLRPAASRVDLSQFLVALDARLKQAEAKLASNTVTPARQPPPMMWEHGDLPLGLSSAPLLPGSLVAISPTGATAQWATATPFIDSRYENLDHLRVLNPDNAAEQTDTECMHLMDGDIPASELLYDVFATTLSSDPPLEQAVPYMDRLLDDDFNTAFFETSSSSTSTGLPDSATPSGLEHTLYERYFEIFHPIMPIINKTRFQAEISPPFLPFEVRQLSYAMQALGALSLGSGKQARAKGFYEQARYYLDVCERQEGGESLANINTLQACALLTLYEFKRPNFARAWITLSRAVKLAKIMGLDKPDGSASLWTNCGPREPPPPPSTPAELEERRRTFWVLYIFDAFASLTTKMPDFRGPILVPLPSPAQDLEGVDESDTMPSLQQVLEVAETAELSPFAGTVIMVSLYQACLEHTESSSHNDSYEFWDAHFRIDKAIGKCTATLLPRHSNCDSALSLGLRMNLGAVAIMLHEAMLTKTQNEDLPASLAAEASSKCVSAVTDIIEAAQAALSLTDEKMEALRQVDRFLLWPVTAAIQVCFRMLYRTQDDAASYIKSLRILAKLVKAYIDPEHIDPVLLQKVDERLAELGG